MIASTRANLVTLVTAPTVWALHFLVSYTAAAGYCAKTMADARVMTGAAWPDITIARLVILAATVVAVAIIALCTRQAWGHWRSGDVDPPFDEPSFEGRQGFLGFATLLLCGLSVVGVIFVALPAVFIGDCR
ncbi:hypothetical protein JOD31_002413 [Methylopila capsulata]|uniref:Uncharacterized protein n=1 Tax=Methylopila capsulata TaxID=61654 RepID=A0A9W6IVH3_9HYPH|nr:hypothetical protein [Methylopila capsulata]MBM7852171.1 hypothetical protein [Methylopila capsulata]GLK56377.1 hypothetical protein GCM10008170_23960 [Methylopila capsulata]